MIRGSPYGFPPVQVLHSWQSIRLSAEEEILRSRQLRKYSAPARVVYAVFSCLIASDYRNKDKNEPALSQIESTKERISTVNCCLPSPSTRSMSAASTTGPTIGYSVLFLRFYYSAMAINRIKQKIKCIIQCKNMHITPLIMHK